MGAADVIAQTLGVFELYGADVTDAGFSIAADHGLLYRGVQDVLDHFAVSDVLRGSASQHCATNASLAQFSYIDLLIN